MGGSSQHLEMQEGCVVHESSQPIYDAAKLCSKHFEHHLNATYSDVDDYLAIEELWGRFNQWAAYVGAFAVPRASLDARLVSHGEIRDMVLELLYMIEDNLIWVNARDNTEISESSPGLPAVGAAVDRLLILSANIRRSPRQTHRLRQVSRNAQDESLCRLLVQTRYPNARKSLCSQLGASIHVRGISLQYMQEHNKKLAYQRNEQGDSEVLERLEEQVNAPVVSLNKDASPKKQKDTRGPETLPSEVSPSAKIRISRAKKTPSSTVTSSGSAVRDDQRNEYDYPLQPKQKDGKRYQPCAICAMPLEPLTLTKLDWEIHVDQDIEPYVCISEDCIEPPQYFTSLQRWMDHMLTRHSMNWPERVHTERWYCDIDHNEPGREPPEFDEKAEFVNHLNTCHGDKLTQSQILGRIRRNRRIATRDPFVCPLCDCVPPDVEKHRGEKPYSLLWKHIAQHLKSVAFLSLSYIGDDLEDRESIADSSSTASSKDSTNISGHSLSDSSHHLYCDRDSCDCRNHEKNSTLDWSSLEATYESTVDIPEDQRPTSHDDPGYTSSPGARSEWEFLYPLSLPPDRKQIGPPEYQGHAKDEKLMKYFQGHPLSSLRPSRRDDFEIAIVCALPFEYDAACYIFDEFWDNNGDVYGRATGDTNTYTTGRVGKHNVVLTFMPNIGKVSMASAAAGMRSSYSNLRLVILTGVCGGVPHYQEKEIILGDVIISKTVLQYDFRWPEKFMHRNTIEDNHGLPLKDIRNLNILFETDFGLDQLERRTAHFLQQLQDNAAHERRYNQFLYPGTAEDKLFAPFYRHRHHVSPMCLCRDNDLDTVCDTALSSSCADLGCDDKWLVTRHRLQATHGRSDAAPQTAVHVGAIMSRNKEIKLAAERDRLSAQENAIAFHMERSGIWDEMPCILVKGVCDYADSHKSNGWQHFAAATAAAASKAILERYMRTDKR